MALPLRDAFFFIGDCPVDAVTPPMVPEVAKNIEKRGAEIARQLLQRLNAVFRYAVQTGRATSYNSAADMQGVLKSRKVIHHSPGCAVQR